MSAVDFTATSSSWPAVSIAEANLILTAPSAYFEIIQGMANGRNVRSWKNAPINLQAVFRQAFAFSNRTFLVLENDRVTYDAFVRATLVLAKYLSDLGVKKGDRVAIIMRNLPEWPVAFFAATIIGAIATPLNAWWTGDELLYGIQDSGAQIVICDGERLSRVSPAIDRLTAVNHLLVARNADKPSHDQISAFEDVVGPISKWHGLPTLSMPAVEISGEDDAAIFYTSGTTGSPKGAIQTHLNAVSAIFAAPFATARSIVRRGETWTAPDLSSPPSVLLSVPFFHATGCHINLCPTLLAGGKIVLQRRFDALGALELIEKEEISRIGGVPTIAFQILEHPHRQKYNLSSLKNIIYGGAPAPPELVNRLAQELPWSVPGFGWGMTETTSVFTNVRGEDYLLRPDSSGPALPIGDMKIIDDDGRDLLPNQVGELLVRGANVIRGYWQKPDADASTFLDGWLRTGDLAKIDEEGFLYVVDRKKDMLIRGGENIYCIEVEDALYSHPSVMDAAVVGIPHPTLGEEPGAIVTLKAGESATEPEIREFVATRIAVFKVPVKVRFSAEPLPRNANGKILKNLLRDQFV